MLAISDCVPLSYYLIYYYYLSLSCVSVTGLRNKTIFYFPGLSLFGAILYSYSPLTTHTYVSPSNNLTYCVPSLDHYKFLTVTVNVDSIITMLLPFLIIAFLNIRIVMLYSFTNQRSLTTFRSTAHHHCDHHDSVDPDSARSTLLDHSILQRNRMQAKITKMLMIVSTSFLILNFPSHAIRMYMFIMKIRGQEKNVERSTIMWQQIAQVNNTHDYQINK